MDRLGLLELLIPELTSTRGVTQPKEHYWDVFDHSLQTVAVVERLLQRQGKQGTDDLLALTPWSPDIAHHFSSTISTGRTNGMLLKLAALLHDIGKPSTKTIEHDGRMRFLGHSQEGLTMAGELLERLRFSNREIQTIQLMIEHHLRPGFLVGEEMPSRRAIYRYFRDTGEAGIDTLFLCLADHLAARGPTLDPSEWHKHTMVTEYMITKWYEEKDTVSPPRLIDGHTLIDRFGLEPGPRVGELLEMVREAQASGDIGTSEEAVEFVSGLLRKYQ